MKILAWASLPFSTALILVASIGYRIIYSGFLSQTAPGDAG